MSCSTTNWIGRPEPYPLGSVVAYNGLDYTPARTQDNGWINPTDAYWWTNLGSCFNQSSSSASSSSVLSSSSQPVSSSSSSNDQMAGILTADVVFFLVGAISAALFSKIFFGAIVDD